MNPLAPRPLGSAPDARAYFLLSCQKKVAKEKARPQRRPASPGALRCSAATGGCGTRGFAPQTVLALFPVAPCAARRRKGQIENRSSSDRMARQTPFGVLFFPPRAAPSNGVGPGVVGEHCLRGEAPSCGRALSDAQHREEVPLGCPAWRVAQGTPAQQGRETGGRLLFGDFFLATQEKVTRRQGGTQRLRFLATLGMTAHPPSARNPAQPRRNRWRRNQCSK